MTKPNTRPNARQVSVRPKSRTGALPVAPMVQRMSNPDTIDPHKPNPHPTNPTPL